MKITIELESKDEIYDLRQFLFRIKRPEVPLETPIDSLNLSYRTGNSLKAAGIYDIGTLLKKTETELMMMTNFGRKSLNEIKDAMSQRGMFLNA